MVPVFLIVGLGNPGTDYKETNHNIGFMCADFLANELGFPQFGEQFEGLCSEQTFEKIRNDELKVYYKVLILKPQTFMNSSGCSIQKYVHFYKIDPGNVVVIHDDLDLKTGNVKTKFSGSSGGHNGIKSIDKLISPEYWRIRIGIGRPANKEYSINDYVLAKISDELKSRIPKIFKVISNNIKEFLLEPSPKSKAISKIKLELQS